ncbi:hypothetical protein FGO68_gene7414 [Halteria grandinella]|uniref:Uncharacterized protein n=1 Tax=Halteria grandinella TaxID=5974 RepID=A0A8J8T1D2_HALGN|nr:hypothetical protein FGO68_gene7414 [Halteria grandinella]
MDISKQILKRETEMNMHLIIERLWLGDMAGAYNKDILKKNGITDILTVAQDILPKFPRLFNYKLIKILDTPSANLKVHFQTCIAFIRDALNRGGCVLVHCYAGISRSATIVIAYLMQEHGFSLKQALIYVKQRRNFIHPNEGFRRQLLAFQRELASKKEQGLRDTQPAIVQQATPTLYNTPIPQHGKFNSYFQPITQTYLHQISMYSPKVQKISTFDFVEHIPKRTVRVEKPRLEAIYLNNKILKQTPQKYKLPEQLINNQPRLSVGANTIGSGRAYTSHFDKRESNVDELLPSSKAVWSPQPTHKFPVKKFHIPHQIYQGVLQTQQATPKFRIPNFSPKMGSAEGMREGYRSPGVKDLEGSPTIFSRGHMNMELRKFILSPPNNQKNEKQLPAGPIQG